MHLLRSALLAGPPPLRGIGTARSRRETGWFLTLVVATVSLDVAVAWRAEAPQWIALAVVLVVAVLAAVRGTARPVLVIALPLVSPAATAAGALTGWGGGQAMYAEVGVLLWALAWQVLRGRGAAAVAVAGADALALLAVPWRVDDGGGRGDALAVLVGLTLLVAGICADRRRRTERRARLEQDVRRQERAAIAVELHDVATHHLTGVVLQAQVARRMTADDPRLPDALHRVERDATDALAALRSLVGVLHTGPDQAPLDPVGGLRSIRDLVDRWPSGATAVTLTLPEPSVEVPAAVGAAAMRVVREALTNVRKHAPSADHVAVEVTMQAGLLLVSVVDSGPTRSREQAPARGGLGLVGLTERVETLGGHLAAGPHGPGWALRAAIPLDAVVGHSAR